jgi:hypothetical protein
MQYDLPGGIDDFYQRKSQDEHSRFLRMLRGTQKEVMTSGKNQKRYLAGALNAHTGELSWVEGDRKTSTLFLNTFAPRLW